MTSNEKAVAVLNALAPTCPKCGRETRIVHEAWRNVAAREACYVCAKWIWNSVDEAVAEIGGQSFKAHRTVALFRDEF